MTDPISKLEDEREVLLHRLAETGDMRRGSITEVYRSCGKPTCRCAAADDPGHGPYFALTRTVDGKTKTIQMRPGPLLTKIEREVETYRTFRNTCDQLIAINENLCDSRPVEASEELKKKRSELSSKRKSQRRSTRS
jgi:hypothetical protein